MKLKPISPPSLKDHIYDAMRAAILEMDIYSGTVDLRLDERSLAEQLGVSRTPLREGLVRLERDGLIEIRPRSGIYVLRKSLEEILDIIVAWAALESMAARLAVERASDPEIASLRVMAARYSETEAGADILEYSENNIRFHQRILEISHCALLARMAEDLFVHMHAVRRRAMGEGDRFARSRADHMGIIEAFEARDAEAAATRVRVHTMRLHDHVRRTWPEDRAAPDRTQRKGLSS
ncbi:MAG: GntR family transcriptional regulator [Pseudomonadota bacterium]